MNLKDFKKEYLSQYILIEKDFRDTNDYVSMSENNYKTFSAVYLKLLLSIGSEVDVVEQLLCELLHTDKAHFNEVEPDFYSILVEVENYDIILSPWKFDGNYPNWWTAYNEIKHNRNCVAEKFDKSKKYFEFANLENVLNALAGLFSLELLAYKKIADENKDEMFVPDIHSIFNIKNLYWENVRVAGSYIYINDKTYLI